MNNVDYGYSTLRELNIVGDKILLRKLREGDFRCEQGIYIPESTAHKNTRIGIAQILDITKKSEEELGLSKGDYVLYDYYSAHGDWSHNVIVNGENIIMQMTEEEAQAYLKGSF